MNLNEFAACLERVRVGRGYLIARCPFHDDREPSLCVYSDSRRFYCYGCQKSGTWEYLWAVLLRGSDAFRHGEGDRIPVLPRTFVPRAQWEPEDLSGYCRKVCESLRELGPAHAYLESRGLGAGIAAAARLGYDNGWYIIPILARDGSVQGAVARAGPSREQQSGMRFDMPFGQRPMLYVPVWKYWDEQPEVYVVFGVFDALSMAAAGLAAASPSSGKNSLDVSWLDDVKKPVILVPDVGEEADAHRYAAQLGWRGRVKTISYENGEKDPNGVLVRRGKDGLLKAVGGYISALE